MTEDLYNFMNINLILFFFAPAAGCEFPQTSQGHSLKC